MTKGIAKTYVLAPVAAAAFAVASVAVAPVAHAGGCLENWAEAAEVVAREKLVTIETLTAMTRRQAGEVVRSALCREDGRYIYRVVLRKPGGGLRNIAVDARQPELP